MSDWWFADPSSSTVRDQGKRELGRSHRIPLPQGNRCWLTSIRSIIDNDVFGLGDAGSVEALIACLQQSQSTTREQGLVPQLVPSLEPLQFILSALVDFQQLALIVLISSLYWPVSKA